MKILIVDDDDTTRLILAETLRNLGHEVVEAAEGASAWAVLRAQAFPVVISDWNMPEMDGLELCRRIRAGRGTKYTYVMLLTVFSGKESFLAGMEAGADDFIIKPLDEQQLAARLRVAERLLALQREVHELSGFLPICSYCKCIRDDQNYWQQLEAYLSARTDAQFTHGICPKCYKDRIVPELKSLGVVDPAHDAPGE